MKVKASPNIAFIKYWGKQPDTGRDEDRNLATNPSLSMTLARAQTTTTAKLSKEPEHKIYLGGIEASPADVQKISRHIERVLVEIEAPKRQRFRIETGNNFPQGTGIASSASGFAALTLAVVGEVLGAEPTRQLLRVDPARLARLARRGSGSACRSLQGGYVKWHGREITKLSSQWQLHDTILIFSETPKLVSSSEGHALAQTSSHFQRRLANLPVRLAAVERALANTSMAALGPLLETEALELHEIARSSEPSITYLTPESQRFIDYLQTTSRRDFYFTLDAGPNVHLISEHPLGDLAEHFAGAGLRSAPRIWADQTGSGPEVIEDAFRLE